MFANTVVEKRCNLLDKISVCLDIFCFLALSSVKPNVVSPNEIDWFVYHVELQPPRWTVHYIPPFLYVPMTLSCFALSVSRAVGYMGRRSHEGFGFSVFPSLSYIFLCHMICFWISSVSWAVGLVGRNGFTSCGLLVWLSISWASGLVGCRFYGLSVLLSVGLVNCRSCRLSVS